MGDYAPRSSSPLASPRPASPRLVRHAPNARIAIGIVPDRSPRRRRLEAVASKRAMRLEMTNCQHQPFFLRSFCVVIRDTVPHTRVLRRVRRRSSARDEYHDRRM